MSVNVRMNDKHFSSVSILSMDNAVLTVCRYQSSEINGFYYIKMISAKR